jgi:uncharacterized membrane protein YebE (DUF533 family)
MAKTSLDFETLAQGVEDVREVINSFVAALTADGFTDDQARDIITGMWRSFGRGDGDA